jgi:hypothetical protein
MAGANLLIPDRQPPVGIRRLTPDAGSSSKTNSSRSGSKRRAGRKAARFAGLGCRRRTRDRRLVLASGGVARDYLSVVREALRRSTERPVSKTRLRNRITAEDVTRAADALYEQKQEELKKDAGEEAEALRSRLSEIIDFAVETNRTKCGTHRSERVVLWTSGSPARSRR